MQIHREVERLAQGKKFRVGLLSKALAATGGALGHFDVLVATPMRLVTALREGVVSLGHVEVGGLWGWWFWRGLRSRLDCFPLLYSTGHPPLTFFLPMMSLALPHRTLASQVVVLDEADKLFELGKAAAHPATQAATDQAAGAGDDKGFLGQVDEVLAACSHPRVQRALFSATLPPAVEELAGTVLRDAVKVTVGTKNAGAATIEQRLIFVGRCVFFLCFGLVENLHDDCLDLLLLGSPCP